jgi:hypothetical protein
VKFTIKGTIKPPRGTTGANGYLVDLEIECPQRLARLIAIAGATLAEDQNMAGEVRDYWTLLVEKTMVEEGTR